MTSPANTKMWVAALAACAMTMGCASSSDTGSGGDDTSSGQGGTTSSGGGVGGTTSSGGGVGGAGGSSPCAVDCTQIQAPDCQLAQCNETTGQCEVVADEDGTSCDDGLFCTANDTCQNGLCEPGPTNDCGIAAAACETIACDENSQSCSTVAGQNGDPCVDPNDLCLESGTCLNGVCNGTPKDCFMQPVPDDCHVSECNPQNGQCEPVVGNEGGACADPNDLCTVNKTCASGVCQGGTAMDCSYLTQGCVTGVCDTNNGQCIGQAVGNGNPCDDLNACTTGEICTNGTCAGGTAVIQCINNDSCCPTNCNQNNDTDCALPFNQSSYNAVLTFTNNALQNRPCGLAWDGANLWTGNLGSSSGNGMAQYTGAGTFVSYYQPSIDFRSVFTKADGSGPLYARPYNSTQIRVMTAPGVFANDVVLAGTAPDGQSSVVWDGNKNELVAQKTGTVRRWSATGAAIGTVALIGYGTMNQESSYPADRGIAWANGFYLTYSAGVLSAWDDQGNRIDTTALNGSTSSSEAHFSISYAQGKVWTVDTNSNGTWRGYDVGL
ncbi:MAG: hypothetical protein JRI68_05355 [Deltaproteobacteria bacterium]|nr:hypothetical protein [Deltaproteobacteria bacterium]